MVTAGIALAQQLQSLGTKNIYCVPGESYLAALDGMYDSTLRIINARQEGGATMMAQAEAKFTHKPGVAFVTRGPGATNASSGVHVAQQDSTPLLLFIGQVASWMRGKDAFQEVDYQSFFGGMAKAVFEVNDSKSLNAIVTQAYEIALSERQGPVIIALPEDILREKGDFTILPTPEILQPHAPLGSTLKYIYESKQCCIIVGGFNPTQTAKLRLRRMVTDLNIAVAASFRRQTLFDNNHPSYIGELGFNANPDLIAYIRNSDLLIILDDRLSEVTSQGYTLLNNCNAEQKRIHIYPDKNEFNRSFVADMHIEANFWGFAESLAETPIARNQQDIETMRQSYLNWSNPTGDDLLSNLMRAINQRCESDAIFTNGAGNYAIWLQRYRKFTGAVQYVAPTSGSMGYGIPAAIAAALNTKNKQIFAFAGDGCFQMTMQEIAVIAEENLNINIIVVDNNRYGTIRMHQQREYPNRTIATDIKNPDFTTIAQAYGIKTCVLEDANEIDSALDLCLSTNKATLIHVKVDPDQLTPTLNISE